MSEKEELDKASKNRLNEAFSRLSRFALWKSTTETNRSGIQVTGEELMKIFPTSQPFHISENTQSLTVLLSRLLTRFHSCIPATPEKDHRSEDEQHENDPKDMKKKEKQDQQDEILEDDANCWTRLRLKVCNLTENEYYATGFISLIMFSFLEMVSYNVS